MNEDSVGPPIAPAPAPTKDSHKCAFLGRFHTPAAMIHLFKSELRANHRRTEMKDNGPLLRYALPYALLYVFFCKTMINKGKAINIQLSIRIQYS